MDRWGVTLALFACLAVGALAGGATAMKIATPETRTEYVPQYVDRPVTPSVKGDLGNFEVWYFPQPPRTPAEGGKYWMAPHQFSIARDANVALYARTTCPENSEGGCFMSAEVSVWLLKEDEVNTFREGGITRPADVARQGLRVDMGMLPAGRYWIGSVCSTKCHYTIAIGTAWQE